MLNKVTYMMLPTKKTTEFIFSVKRKRDSPVYKYTTHIRVLLKENKSNSVENILCQV